MVKVFTFTIFHAVQSAAYTMEMCAVELHGLSLLRRSSRFGYGGREVQRRWEEGPRRTRTLAAPTGSSTFTRRHNAQNVGKVFSPLTGERKSEQRGELPSDLSTISVDCTRSSHSQRLVINDGS